MSKQSLAPRITHRVNTLRLIRAGGDGPVAVDTFGGRVHVEWDARRR